MSRRLVIAFKFHARGRGPINRGRTRHGKLVAQSPKAIAEPLQARHFLAKSRLARELSHLELTGSRFHLDFLARVVPVGTATRAQEVEPTGLRSQFSGTSSHLRRRADSCFVSAILRVLSSSFERIRHLEQTGTSRSRSPKLPYRKRTNTR